MSTWQACTLLLCCLKLFQSSLLFTELATNFLMCNGKFPIGNRKLRGTQLCILGQCFSHLNTHEWPEALDKMCFWFSRSEVVLLLRARPGQDLRWWGLRKQRRAWSIKFQGPEVGRRKASEGLWWKPGMRREEAWRDSQKILSLQVWHSYRQIWAWEWGAPIFSFLWFTFLSV